MERIRVMTWNLWWRFGDEWRDRQAGIRSVIGATGADVIGLQEVWGDGRTSQAAVLGEALGLHAVFATPSLPPPPEPLERDDQRGMDVGVGILSRWPIRETHRHLLRSANRDETVVLIAVVDHPMGPLPVLVTCLDWEPPVSPTRQRQAEAMVELAMAPELDGPMPIVLTGDFNVPPDAPEIAAITASMTDAWPAVHGSADPGVTLSSGNRFASADAWQIDRRIDYVFVRPGRRPVEVDAAFIAGDDEHGVPPSDHFAVVVDLRIG